MLEMLVGLEVINDIEYTKYREYMTPLLKEHGGNFGYDFKISEVLKSEVQEPINRLFTIFFPDKEVMESFFENEEYLQIKNDFFIDAVKSTTIISSYNR